MSDARDTIALLEAERKKRQADLEMYQRNAAACQAEIDHFDAVISSLRRRHNMTSTIGVSEIADMTQHDAMKHIARVSNGLLRVAEARRLFIEAGFGKATRNISPAIYTLIRSHPDEWEKVDKGVYQLKDAGTRSEEKSDAYVEL